MIVGLEGWSSVVKTIAADDNEYTEIEAMEGSLLMTVLKLWIHPSGVTVIGMVSVSGELSEMGYIRTTRGAWPKRQDSETIRNWPSGENSTNFKMNFGSLTNCLWNSGVPDGTSQQKMSPCEDPDMTRSPSGQNATDSMFLWPHIGGCAIAPVLRLQIRTVLSLDPDRICIPSDENATETTAFSCPRSLRTSLPNIASHTVMVVSAEPDATNKLSGEKAMDITVSLWPCNGG